MAQNVNYIPEIRPRVPAAASSSNVTFRETRDDAVYFDRRPGLVASPVQTYLELATGDKRSQETAEQVHRAIVGALATARSEAS